MTRGLSEREKEEIRALAKASSEALVATAKYMQERETKRPTAKTPSPRKAIAD